MDSEIISKLEKTGINFERLDKVLESNDNWGSLVHAFEVLTVLGVVHDAMKEQE